MASDVQLFGHGPRRDNKGQSAPLVPGRPVDGQFERIRLPGGDPVSTATYETAAADAGKYIRIRVRYTDAGPNPRKIKWAEATWPDPVGVDNTAPSFDRAGPVGFPVAENSPPGTIVGEVGYSDPDSLSVTCALSGPDASSFTVDNDCAISTSTGASFDFEGAKTTYSVTLSLSDGTDPAGTPDSAVDDTIDVTITVSDANEAPTVSGGPTSASVTENSTAVAGYTAADEDASVALSWSTGGDDGSLFEVDASGRLSFKSAPSYEAPGDLDGDNVYDVAVIVTDAGGLSDRRDVAVTVTPKPMITDLTVTVTRAADDIVMDFALAPLQHASALEVAGIHMAAGHVYVAANGGGLSSVWMFGGGATSDGQYTVLDHETLDFEPRGLTASGSHLYVLSASGTAHAYDLTLPHQLERILEQLREVLYRTEALTAALEHSAAAEPDVIARLAAAKKALTPKLQAQPPESVLQWNQRASRLIAAARHEVPPPLLVANNLINATVGSLVSLAVWNHSLSHDDVLGSACWPDAERSTDNEDDSHDQNEAMGFALPPLPRGHRLQIKFNPALFAPMDTAIRLQHGEQQQGIVILKGLSMSWSQGEEVDFSLDVVRLADYESCDPQEMSK